MLSTLVLMGKHVQRRAWSEFGNKITHQTEGLALKMNQEQIDRSIRALENSAHLICDVLTDPKQFNSSQLIDQSLSSIHREEEWIISLNQNLLSFSENLPTHRRLAVATGIAAFVRKHGNQFGSLVKPLIQSITTLFRHLQQETVAQMSLLQYVSFSNIFTRVTERTIEINKLFVFGQHSSKSTLSELVGTNMTNQLLTMVQNSFLHKFSTFTQERILQRMLNHADFSITEGKSESDMCLNFPNSCLCSYRKVKITFPSIPKERKCLAKKNTFQFRSSNETYLADGTKAITITRQRNSKERWGSFVKILRPPVVQMKSKVNGFLVSRRAVMFPDGLRENVSVSCNSANTTQLSILPRSVLRLIPGCNYTSNQIQIYYPSTKSNATIVRKKIEEIKEFTIFQFDHQIDNRTLNMMEMKFSEALLNEDLLQLKLKEIAAQSWLQVFLSRWIEYTFPVLLPVGLTVISLVTLPILLYFNCCCCCCKRNNYSLSKLCLKNKSPEDADLEKRVSKLETFFEFFIQDQYHHISENDVRRKIVSKKESKDE